MSRAGVIHVVDVVLGDEGALRPAQYPWCRFLALHGKVGTALKK